MNDTSLTEPDYAEYMDKPMEGESSKQFTRYCIYRDMHPNDRSIARVAERIEENPKNLEYASSRYSWVARALEYDKKMQNLQMVVRQANIEEAVKGAMVNEDEELVALSEIVQKKMRQALDTLKDPTAEYEETVSIMDIHRLIKSAEALQNMRRRRVGLPVSFKAEVVEDMDYANEEFLIGGGE